VIGSRNAHGPFAGAAAFRAGVGDCVVVLEAFHKHFPRIGRDEARTVMLRGGTGGGIPDGDYLLLESYCSDRTCDCRRVMLNVFSPSAGIVASISYGFDRNGSMPGPFLDPMNEQSTYAPEVLDLVRTVVLSDPEYVARLERHYNMMKDKLGRPHADESPWWKRKRKKPRRRFPPGPGAE
jgi:hypothetical protein